MLKLIFVLGGALCHPDVGSAFAATTKINKKVYSSSESVGAPRSQAERLLPGDVLRLKKIFLFPGVDDLSGALSPKLDEKLIELISKNTRFELIRDPQVVKALSPDEAAYFKAAQNQDVHREAAKVTGADTTIILKTHNIGPNTQMRLELRDAQGALIFSEDGSIPGGSSMDVRAGLIETLYRGILSRLPFEGSVTGRTASTITVDLGIGSLRQGEEVEIARIVSLQRHPLLGTVVGTDYVRTGKAKVTSVDRVLSFAEITEEFPGEKIAPGQKLLLARANVIHRADPQKEPTPAASPRSVKKQELQPRQESNFSKDPLEDRLKGEFDRPKPRFGSIGANLNYGSISHSQSVSGVTTDYAGTGLGADIPGELWVTKNWILSLNFGFQNANLSGGGSSIGSTSWREFMLAPGYRIFPAAMAEGIVLTGSLGFQSMSFDIPDNSAKKLGSKKYSGLVLKADGEVFFLEGQKLDVGFLLQPFSSVNEQGTTFSTPSSGTVIGVHLGWNRQLVDELWVRVGGRYDIASASYENSSNSISDKRFAIGPGIYYLF